MAHNVTSKEIVRVEFVNPEGDYNEEYSAYVAYQGLVFAEARKTLSPNAWDRVVGTVNVLYDFNSGHVVGVEYTIDNQRQATTLASFANSISGL